MENVVIEAGTSRRTASGEAAFRQALDAARTSALERLFTLQKSGGYWLGRFEATVTTTALYVTTLKYLGLEDRLEPWREKFLSLYWKRLTPTGGWRAFHGGEDNIGVCVEAYFACLLLGAPASDPRMVRARQRILELGGLNAAPLFSQYNVAVLGQFPWDYLPTIAPEVMLFPNKPLSIYSFASYARQFFVPLSILVATHASRPVPPQLGLQDLFSDGGPRPMRPTVKSGFFSSENAVVMLERFLSFYNRRPNAALRKKSLAAAEQWILQRIDDSGNFSGIIQPLAYAAMALSSLGYSSDGAVIQGLVRAMDALIFDHSDHAEVQNCESPLWDTSLCVHAALDLDPERGDPRLMQAQKWILERQILDVRGDWSVSRPNLEPGGWAFEFTNPYYPDIDDTAVSASALVRLDRAGVPAPTQRVIRAMRWLTGMQSRCGGWAAFDPDVDSPLVQNLAWNDINGFVDPPAPDVTGRVLEAIGTYGRGQYQAQVDRAIEWLQRTQTPRGTWSARWMINHLHGTSFALTGAAAVGRTAREPWLQRAADWLISRQNSDGGWGEHPDSYNDEKLWGVGASTVSQTAWTLLGLHGAALPFQHPAVKKGLEYLIERQRLEGDWFEEEFTGVGFPGLFYMYYGMYGVHWPMMALGRWWKEARK